MGAKAEAQAFLRLNGADFERGLRRAKRDMEGFRTSVDREMRKAALALAGVAVASTAVGASFEAQSAKVRAVSRATASEMAQLEQSARSLGATTMFSATQVMEAQENLLRAGLGVKRTMDALTPTLALAAASGKDMAFSAELVAGSLSAFQLDASEATRVVNTLYAATTETRLDLDRIDMALKNAGPTAATFGMEIEETVAHLGSLVQVLGDGSRAGTSMRAILLKLNEATANNQGVIGQALQGWNIQSEGLTGALTRLEAAGVTAEQAILQLGMEAGPGMAVLMRAGSKAIEELQQKITGTNAAFNAMDIMMATIRGQWMAMRSALEELALRLYDTFKVQLGDALAEATRLVQENYDRIEAAALQLVEAFTRVVDVVKAVAGFISDNRGVFEWLAGSLAGMVVTIYLVSTAMGVLNAVMALNPVMLIVAGVGLLIGAFLMLVRHLGGFQSEWIKTVAVAKLAWIQLKSEVEMLWNSIRFGIDLVLSLPEYWTRSIDLIWDALKIFGAMAIDMFKNIGRAIIQPWKAGEILGEIKESFSTTISDLMAAAGEADFGSIWSGLVESHDEANALVLARWRETAEQIRAEREAALAGLQGAADGIPGTGATSEVEQLIEVEEAKKEIRARYGEEYQGWLSEFGEQVQVHLDGEVEAFARAQELKAYMYQRTSQIASAAYGALRQEAAKTANFEMLQKIQMGKLFARVATEAAAAELDAQGQVAMGKAMMSVGMAIFAAAQGNFASAAQYGLAAVKFTAIAGGMAIGASVVRGMGSGSAAAMDSAGAEAASADAGGADGGMTGRRGMDVTTRQAPETVNIYLTTSVYGNVIGDSGMDELVDRYLIPRLRPLMEGGAL